MNWDALGAIAESVGALGVIVSLVYLALQVRQNTQQIRLSRFQETSSSLQDGLIDAAVFESTIALMRKLLIESPGGSSYWEEHRHMYTEAMRAAVEHSTPGLAPAAPSRS